VNKLKDKQFIEKKSERLKGLRVQGTRHKKKYYQLHKKFLSIVAINKV
jgi:hypothetical protein